MAKFTYKDITRILDLIEDKVDEISSADITPYGGKDIVEYSVDKLRKEERENDEKLKDLVELRDKILNEINKVSFDLFINDKSYNFDDKKSDTLTKLNFDKKEIF